MAKRRSRFAFARFGCFGGQARTEKKAEDGYPVKLHIYDLSHGMARQLSTTILGKAIEGIWHTGVVVYGCEYYFGGGIQKVQPGRTPYGTPVRAMDLGVTYVPQEMFKEFLQEIGPRYTPATYNLLTHNCNNFSNEVAQFLAGTTVPSFILELPNEVINSPVGAILLPPMIQGLDASLRAGAVPQPPQLKPATQPSVNDVEVRSTPADKPEDGKQTAGNGADKSSTVVPLAVQPAAPPAAAAQVTAQLATKTAHQDPLEEAKTRAQEDIEDVKMADNGNDNSSVVVPPAVQPAPVDTATETRPSMGDVEQGSAAPGKPEDSKTAGNGNAVVPPAASPAAAAQVSAAPEVVVTKAAHQDPMAEEKSQVKEETEDGKMADNGNDNSSAVVPPAAPPPASAEVSAAPAMTATKAAPADPLAEAKSRVQEEIKREFAAIMAPGTARPGEAAALAVRRVMERHGLRRAAVAVQRG